MVKGAVFQINESLSAALHLGDAFGSLFVGSCLQGKTSHSLQYEVPNVSGFMLCGNIHPLSQSDTFLSLLSDSLLLGCTELPVSMFFLLRLMSVM